MINCVIVDDEPGNVRVLEKMLDQYCPQVMVCGEASDAEKAEKLIREVQPELVFLDIEMPHGNAFDLLDRMMPVEFDVIFVTAFDEYTLKAFKYSILDYLLKPVNIEDLQQAVEKASERLRLRKSSAQLNNLLANLRQPDPLAQKLAIPTSEGIVFVQVDAITRCEAKGSYVMLHFRNGEKILSSRNIREYEKLLPPSHFLRVHNSYIINLMDIKKYHKGRGGTVEMQDRTVIEIAIRRKNEFLSRFRM